MSTARGHSTRECPVCDRPVHDATICTFCIKEITKCLVEVPMLLDELEINASGRAQTGPGRSGGRSAGTPLPYGARAADAIRQLTSILVGWAATTIRDSWHPPLIYAPPPTTAISAARQLLTHINDIRQHPMAEKLYDHLTRARAHAYSVIDRPTDLVPAGRCDAINPDDGTACPEILYADPHRATVRCPCGAEHDLDRTWMLHAAREEVLTAAEIGRITPGITSAMVRRYAQRGMISPCASRILGPNRAIPAYRVGDLLDVVAPHRESA